MKYSITFCEQDYDKLTNHLFNGAENEMAAYVLCRSSISESETRLIVTKIIPVIESDITESSPMHMVIPSKSFVSAMKLANDTKQCFLFVHSHPNHSSEYSIRDNIEEGKLFKTAYTRISTKGVHGSILFSSPSNLKARIFLNNNTIIPVVVVRSIGKRFKFYYDSEDMNIDYDIFDRQIRAFGSDGQKLLSKLNIGIIGCGGTGSSVAEQLIRLGVKNIIISDDQQFEKSNVNRLHGSRLSDEGMPKVEIINRLANDIGLGTNIIYLQKNITFQSVIKKFRDCDIIFGCTDDEWGRSILTRMAIYYIIPVFDMGVKIDSNGQDISNIEGRVTTLLPNEACLFCRGRITSSNIESESLEATSPVEARQLRREGYIPTLEERAPSVIPFTTSIASLSIIEFMHRLTGCLGQNRSSTEIICQFHETKLRTNRTPSKQDCICGDHYYIGRSDVEPFLDTTWRSE